MTTSVASIVLISGVLALVLAALSISGLRAAARQNLEAALPFSAEAQRLFNLPRSFTPIFFGAISVAFPDALTSTAFGTAVCVGMSVYFALQWWAYAKSPEMRVAGPYIGTYLAFASAVGYGMGAVAPHVI